MVTRQKYREHGVAGFYQKFGAIYQNPLERQVRELTRWSIERLQPKTALDLACGSGECTLVLQEHHVDVKGIDPYCHMAYKRRTGQDALRATFDEVAAGSIYPMRWDMIICSFAMHLIEPSKLFVLLWRLRAHSDRLVIITPHKRPVIKPNTWWMLHEERSFERVRGRIYVLRSDHGIVS